MAQTATVSLKTHLAAWIARERQARAWSQDDLAHQIRSQGAIQWRRETVVAIERGARGVGIEELIVLAVVFETTVAGAFAGDAEITIGEGTTMSSGFLRLIFSGEKLPPMITSENPNLEYQGPASTKRAAAKLWPGATVAQIAEADCAALGSAERHLAGKLTVKPVEVSLAAFARWGHSLTDERDRRYVDRLRKEFGDASEVSPGQRQALRGHVTRGLLEELRPTVRQLKGAKG